MLIVGNGTLITLGKDCRVIYGGAALLENGKISRVGDTKALKTAAPDAEYIDCGGKLIMPGLICAHTHTYSAFARGMNLKGEPPANFSQILEQLWWRLDRALTLEDIYYSALVTFAGCVKHGTTTVVDHHAGPGAVSGSLETIAAAARKTGLRVNLCYEVSDRDGEEIAAAGLEENSAFIKKCAAENSPLVSASFGLHASFTIGPSTMEKCARVVQDLGAGAHIHVAESREDAQHCREAYGMGVVERLDRFNLLGPQTLAAHCVHIEREEMDLLARSQTGVVHNPQSNMNNAVGCAPVGEMLERGVIVGMGTDGMTTDMFEAVKTAHLLHKHCRKDPRAGWDEARRMQLVHNPRIMANLFPLPLGELTPGTAADLIVVDYDPPTPLTADNYFAHLAFGIDGGAVETTIVDGKILMQGGKLSTVDEKELNAAARELAAKLWKRI